MSSFKSSSSSFDLRPAKVALGGTRDSCNTDWGDIKVREMTSISSYEELDLVEDITLSVGGECGSKGIIIFGIGTTKR